MIRDTINKLIYYDEQKPRILSSPLNFSFLGQFSSRVIIVSSVSGSKYARNQQAGNRKEKPNISPEKILKMGGTVREQKIQHR